MNILSLFDGMACGMIAMQKAGIEVDRYVAYEIDKYAVQTSTHNFPMIEHRGDVFKADFTEFEGWDFVLAGFPCTKFSIAQKNDRETKPYSGEGWDLFEQAWRAVCEAKPKYFLFENNKSMAKAVQQEISKIVGFTPICINSALVSAQNRQRLYWVGKRNEDGTYSKVQIEQPEDRGILLKDILDSGSAYREKSNCLCGGRGGTSLACDLTQSRHNYAAEPVASMVLNVNPSGKGMNGSVGRIDAKTRCLTTNKGEGMKVIVPVSEPVNVTEDGKSQTLKAQYCKNSVANFCCYSSTYGASGVAEPVHGMNGDTKCRTLTANYWKTSARDAFVDCAGGRTMAAESVPCYATPCEWDENGKPIKAISAADGKTYTVYEVKDGQITIKGKQYPIKLADGFYIIRKLTVRECMRLQTVPEWYEFPVSDSQAYKMLGNGWTCDVICWLLTACMEANEVSG